MNDLDTLLSQDQLKIEREAGRVHGPRVERREGRYSLLQLQHLLRLGKGRNRVQKQEENSGCLVETGYSSCQSYAARRPGAAKLIKLSDHRPVCNLFDAS
ncbi:hypothetical protein Dimus_021884 [Dionaea muscipula]